MVGTSVGTLEICDLKLEHNTEKEIELENKILELEKENREIASQMPWNTTPVAKSLHITDSAKYSKNKLSISGDLEQEKRSGYNLFDYINKVKKGTNYGVTITTDDEGYIIANGTIQDSYKSLVVPYSIDNILEDTETYTVWQEKHSSGLDGIYVQLKLVNKSTQAETFVYASNINRKVVVDKNTYNYYINIQWATAEQVFSNYKNRYMLLKGDYTTTATEFEKYGATPSTEFPSIPLVCTGAQKIITCKKNILNTQKNASSTSNGVTATTDENGIITVNGTTLGATYIKLHDDLKVLTYSKYLAENEKKYFSRGKYILSFKYISGTKTNGNSSLNLRSEFSEPDVNVSITGINIENKNIKFELTDNLHLLTYLWLNSNVTFTDYKFSIQIERVNTLDENVTEYESYSGTEDILDLKNIELCKIINSDGNIVAKDRHVYRNSKWQWEKNVGKKIFNGTEDFDLWGNGTDSAYRMIYKGLTSTIKKNGLILSNFYSTKLAPQLYDFEVGIATDANGNIIIHDNDFTTTDSYKTNLAQKHANGTPLTAYYPLATPEYVDCTAEQSAVLDKICNNFELAKGINNIIVESENGVGVNLELDYMQDLQAKLNLLEAMCVSNASQEV